MGNAKRIAAASVASVLLAAGALAGLLEYGQYGQAASGYSSAGLGLATEPAGLGDPVLGNPALLAGRRGVWAQASGAVDWIQEKRTREVFDSYDNSVGLSTELLHSQFYYGPRSFSAGYGFKPAGLPRLGAGFGYAREYSFDYDYRKEIRDAFYYPTELRTVNGLGQINRFTGVLSCHPMSRLALGIGLSRLHGHQEVRVDYTYYDPTQEPFSFSQSRSLKGNRLEAGIWALPAKRLSLGVTAHTPAKLTGDIWARLGDLHADTSSSVTYPAGYTFGLSYYPANDFPATVSLEYAYTPWHRLKDNLNPDHRLQPVNSYGLVIEHRLAGGLPLRFGVAFANSYLDRGIGLARAGLGTEVPAGPVAVAVGANVGRRSYNLGQATGTTDPTTVTESLAELSVTVSLR
jgi:hypothetical protein